MLKKKHKIKQNNLNKYTNTLVYISLTIKYS